MARYSTVIAILTAVSTIAHAQKVESIITCPGEDTSKEMRISWASDVKGTYVVYSQERGKSTSVKPEYEELCTVYDTIYSKAPDGSNIHEDARFIKCGATLSGLKKDTDYSYTICSPDGKVLCDEHHFKTSGAKEWSACIISDFHSYTPLPHRLEAAMGMVSTVKAYDPSFDWILHIGDVVAWGGSWSFWKALYAEPYFSDYFWAGLNGNHDNMTRRYQLTNEFFRNANYLPQNGYEGEKGVCYHFMYSDVLFVMLNNEDMRSDEGLAAAQEWVKNVITEARASSHKPRFVVVCEHYQWFFGKDGKLSQYNRWHELFDELKVDVAISGNNHIYVRSNPLYEGKVADGKTGTVYLQTSASDNERGEEMDPGLTYNQDFIVKRFTEGPKTISAIDMGVTPKQISFTLLDRDGKIQDSFTVPYKKK